MAFLGIFVAVQWPFAEFLMTPLRAQLDIRNRIHGFQHARASSLRAVRVRSSRSADRVLAGDGLATLMSWLMVWLGIHAGRFMQKVRR